MLRNMIEELKCIFSNDMHAMSARLNKKQAHFVVYTPKGQLTHKEQKVIVTTPQVTKILTLHLNSCN